MGAASPRPCVACGGPMELGTLLDRTYSATGHALWARVNPVVFGGAQTRQLHHFVFDQARDVLEIGVR